MGGCRGGNGHGDVGWVQALARPLIGFMYKPSFRHGGGGQAVRKGTGKPLILGLESVWRILSGVDRTLRPLGFQVSGCGVQAHDQGKDKGLNFKRHRRRSRIPVFGVIPRDENDFIFLLRFCGMGLGSSGIRSRMPEVRSPGFCRRPAPGRGQCPLHSGRACRFAGAANRRVLP